MSGFVKFVSSLSLLAGLAAAAMVGGSGPLHKFGLIGWEQAIAVLPLGLFVGTGAVVLALTALVLRFATGRGSAGGAGIGLALGAIAAAFVLRFAMAAEAVPPIHDITTDTDNPPQFVAAIAARRTAEAANPPGICRRFAGTRRHRPHHARSAAGCIS